MNKMIAITIRPGATTAACRLIVSGNASPIMPPPAATSTRKNVPRSSEKRRRHSCFGSWKSSTGSSDDRVSSNHSWRSSSVPDALSRHGWHLRSFANTA